VDSPKILETSKAAGDWHVPADGKVLGHGRAFVGRESGTCRPGNLVVMPRQKMRLNIAGVRTSGPAGVAGTRINVRGFNGVMSWFNSAANVHAIRSDAHASWHGAANRQAARG
jgi:hypothetical protein